MKSIIKHKKSQMELSIISVVTNFFAKSAAVLQSCWGWLGTVALSFLAFIAPISTMLIVLLVIVLVDLLLGVYINRKHIQSSKLRNTVVKASFYMTVIILAFAIENALGLLILAPIIFAICALVELISVIANMSIVLPNIKVFNVIRQVLKTEIANKANLTGDEVDKLLEHRDEIDDMLDKSETSTNLDVKL